MTDTDRYRDEDGRLNVLVSTVRIEVPVLFPYPSDADERGVTWDEINETAISAVCDILPPSFTREAVAEMVALRGPGSSGHYIGIGAEDRVSAPHLTVDFPAAKPKPTAVVETIYPGTPEWDASEIALAKQRRQGG